MTPGVSIRITNMRIQGTFAWDVTAAVDPAEQDIPRDSNGTARYIVVATQGDAVAFPPVRYVIEGEITVSNSYDTVLPIARVSAVYGNDRVTAICDNPPAGITPQSTAKCIFQLQYMPGQGPLSGLLRAEVTTPDKPSVRVAAANGAARFDFTNADISAAVYYCVLLSMSFHANEGMSLMQLNDLGAVPLTADGQPVRVCSTTRFKFDVLYTPNALLPCGPKMQLVYQPVIGTVTLSGEGASSMPPVSAAAAANISVTCPSYVSINNGPPPDPPVTPDDIPGKASVTVTLGDISIKPVANTVWDLKMLPIGMPGNKATMPAGGNVSLRFDVQHTRTVETVTGYYGTVRITNCYA